MESTMIDITNPQVSSVLSKIDKRHLPGLLRFIKKLVGLNKSGVKDIDGDEMLKIAKSCFGPDIAKIDFTEPVEDVLVNLAKFFGVCEEDAYFVKNTIYSILEG